MKIAVVGKGGSGKTTTAAILARSLARRGMPVVALDCDTNPNLGISLGVGDEETARLVALRDALDEGAPHAPAWTDLVDRFGTDAPDGVRLAVVSRIEKPNPGCPCCGLSPERLLGEAVPDGAVVVADFEAGIGTLTRLGDAVVDHVVVVVEPTAKSVEVARRVAVLARERPGTAVTVVANKLRAPGDADELADALGATVVAVPDDPALLDTERAGTAPLDAAPDAPAVTALAGLADRIMGHDWH